MLSNPNEEFLFLFIFPPEYIVPSAVALVCVVALVGGICFFWKRCVCVCDMLICCSVIPNLPSFHFVHPRRTSTVAQPLPAEQIPMVKEPSESAPASDPSSQ